MGVARTEGSVVAVLALVVIMITGHTSAEPQGTLKNKTYYSQILEGAWHG